MRHSRSPVLALALLTTTFLVCGLLSRVSAQQLHAAWSIGDDNVTMPIDAMRVSDTSFLVLSHVSSSFPIGDLSYAHIAHYTIDGTLLWEVRTDPRSRFAPIRFLSTSDGWKMLCSIFGSATAVYGDMEGMDLREQALSNAPGFFSTHVAQLDDGSYVLVEEDRSTKTAYAYSENDVFRWQRTFENDSPSLMYGADAIGNDVVLASRALHADTSIPTNTIVHRLSDSGRLVWKRSYGSTVHEACLNILALADGTCMIGGFRQEYRFGGPGQLSVLHIGGDGDSLATLLGRPEEKVVPRDLIQRSNGRVLVTVGGSSTSAFCYVDLGELPGITYLSPIIIEPAWILCEVNNSTVIALSRATSSRTAPTGTSIHNFVSVWKLDRASGVNVAGEHTSRIFELR